MLLKKSGKDERRGIEIMVGRAKYGGILSKLNSRDLKVLYQATSHLDEINTKFQDDFIPGEAFIGNEEKWENMTVAEIDSEIDYLLFIFREKLEDIRTGDHVIADDADKFDFLSRHRRLLGNLERVHIKVKGIYKKLTSSDLEYESSQFGYFS
jgi:hypothetical protein